MTDNENSGGSSSAIFHQISPPQHLDLKHSGEVTENWKLWNETLMCLGTLLGFSAIHPLELGRLK